MAHFQHMYRSKRASRARCHRGASASRSTLCIRASQFCCGSRHKQPKSTVNRNPPTDEHSDKTVRKAPSHSRRRLCLLVRRLVFVCVFAQRAALYRFCLVTCRRQQNDAAAAATAAAAVTQRVKERERHFRVKRT